MIEPRQAHLNATAKYLKPDGRIAVIDKNREDSPGSWMWLNQSDVGHVDGRHFFLSGREIRGVRQPVFCRLPTAVWQQHSAQETGIAAVDESSQRRMSIGGSIS